MRNFLILAVCSFAANTYAADQKLLKTSQEALEAPSSEDGVIVTRLVPSSLFYKLGLRNGDKLMSVGPLKTTRIGEFAEAYRLISTAQEPVEVVFERDGEVQTKIFKPAGK
jgi:S1-C subfamily serine protease